jgi:outer membrane protein
MNSSVAPYLASSPYAAIMARESATSYDNLSAAVTVSQTIWDFGRTMGGWDAARADVRAKTADLATSADQVRLNVIQAYMGVLASEQVVTIAEETRRQMRDHLAQARALVEAGTRSPIDVTRAETDLANAELNVIRARNGLLMARVGLEGAMGVTVGDFRVERPAVGPDPDVSDLDAAVKEAADRRPEVRSLREKVAALEGVATVARSGWYPAIGASGSLAYTGYKVQDMVYNWGLGVSLTWNAFAGLGTVNGIGEAEANIAAVRATLDSVLLGIRTEVESAAVSWNEAREKLGPARAFEKSASETLALAEGRYAAGSGSIIEVSDAQALVVAAKAGVIQAGYDADTARAKLLKALGRIGGGTRGE